MSDIANDLFDLQSTVCNKFCKYNCTKNEAQICDYMKLNEGKCPLDTLTKTILEVRNGESVSRSKAAEHSIVFSGGISTGQCEEDSRGERLPEVYIFTRLGGSNKSFTGRMFE